MNKLQIIIILTLALTLFSSCGEKTSSNFETFTTSDGEFKVLLPSKKWELSKEDTTYYIEDESNIIGIEVFNENDFDGWDIFKNNRLEVFNNSYGDFYEEETIETDYGLINRYYYSITRDGMKLKVILDLRHEKDTYLKIWSVVTHSSFEKMKPTLIKTMESIEKK